MKIDRSQLRRMILNEIKSLQEGEDEEVPVIEVEMRGTTKIDHKHGGQKEYKLSVPVGFKLMFGAKKEITVNGMKSKLIQGEHRISVKIRGSYYIESAAQVIKVKPVRGR